MSAFTLVGIYGGTFDPIHYGHLRVAQELADDIEFDRFYVVPAGEPRLRAVPAGSKTQRAQMVALAIQGNPAFTLDEREINRSGVSVTVESLKEYQQECQAYYDNRAALCFIIGADSFLKIRQWHEWQTVFQLCHLIVVDRPGSQLMQQTDRLPAEIRQASASRWVIDPRKLTSQPHGLIYVAPTTLLDISATRIRALVAAGKSVRYLLPDCVADYIKTQHLYGKT